MFFAAAKCLVKIAAEQFSRPTAAFIGGIARADARRAILRQFAYRADEHAVHDRTA